MIAEGKNRIVRERKTGSLPAMTNLLLIALFLASPVSAPAEQGFEPRPGDEQRLAGKWFRPDGGYILELSTVKKGGGLKAAYLNPRPINVAKASWRKEQGKLVVFVELRDVNYPGSTYTLVYVPDQDRLVGYYYQAVLGQTFEVLFERKHGEPKRRTIERAITGEEKCDP